MTRKLFVKSYGCQMNAYDAQRMADTLAPEGYVETAGPDGADLIILNTCHIREKAADKVYSELGRLRVLKEQAASEGRRVVLVFTDGDDTASHIRLGAVIDRARTEEMMIYAIGLQSEYGVGGGRIARTKPDRGLRKLAEETGGGYFELEKTTELAPTFTRVAQELHSQYVLGFAPTQLDGRVHKLTVRMKQPGMTARARRSYVAATDKSTVNQK